MAKNTTAKTIERYISQVERDALPESDFAGPGTSFPITDQSHLDAAVKDLGRESPEEQAKIKARIKEIAARKGLKLPDSWQNEKKDQEERMAGISTPTKQPTSFSFYAPFVRIDGEQQDKREVLGKATRGTPIDSYKTVITYEASKKAFSRAKRIPVREMHQAKAVGKGLEWWGVDADEDIYLHSYISRGAEDTWTKVKEDILVGYSIKGENARYGTVERNGKTVTAIVDYDLVEVSLVDNPSCPGCDIAIMRADGIDQEVIASDEELAEVFQRIQSTEQTPPAQVIGQPTEIERKNVSISSANREKIHASRDALTSMCADAGCPDCQAMMNGESDNDGDEDMMERVAGVAERALAPVYARMNAYLGEFARRQSETATLAATIQRVVAMVEALPDATRLDEVQAMIKSVKDQVEQFGKTPVPGGPHTGRTASKSLSTDTPAQKEQETPDIMQQLLRAGVQLNPAQAAQLVATNLKRM